MPNTITKIGRSRAAFAARLRRIRLNADLTQKDLEELSGIPKSRISRYENGHLLPSFQGLRRLADSLGVPESTLLDDAEEPMSTFIAALRRLGVEIESTLHAESLAITVAETVGREASLSGSAIADVRR